MATRDSYLKQRKRRKLAKLLSLLGLLVLFGGLVYFLGFVKYFLVKNVDAGVEDSEKEKITEALWNEMSTRKFGFIPGNNILLFNKNKTSQKLLENYPLFKSFGFVYDFQSQTLSAKGEIRKTALRLCQTSEAVEGIDGEVLVRLCFSVDETGTAFYPNFEPENAFLIQDFSGRKMVLGKLYLSKEMVGFVSRFKELAQATVSIKSGVIEKDYFEARFIKLITEDGWFILSELSLAPETVFENMSLVLGKELQGKFDGLEYLDLRYKDKAYYKLR